MPEPDEGLQRISAAPVPINGGTTQASNSSKVPEIAANPKSDPPVLYGHGRVPPAFIASLICLVLMGLVYAFSMSSNDYETVKSIAPLAGVAGFAATITMGIGLAQMTWLSFKRVINTPAGQTVLPFNSSYKAAIVLITVSVPFIFVAGLGLLGLIAGIVLLAIASKTSAIPAGATPVPGPVKYIVTIIIVLIGGLSAAIVSAIIYILIDTRICELSGSSKCY